MSHVLEIVAKWFLPAIGLGFAGWVLFRALKRSYDPAKLLFKWVCTAVVGGVIIGKAMPLFARGGEDALIGLFLTLFCGIALAITWRHSITDLIANPIGSLYDGGREEVEPKPFYSIALSQRKRNKPLEAIVEIRKQLAKFPDDFEGIMLLASIQAEDLKDLPSAELTLNRYCDRPEAPPQQVAAAWTQLADWHIRILQEVESGRAWLEKIIERYPNTQQALAAAQRLAHLGGTKKILLDARDRQPVAVPEGVKNIGLLQSTEFLRPTEDDPGKLAAEYVKHLEAHPLDTEVREKLAILYARQFKRVDLAMLELEQLINQPNQPPKRVAQWVNLLADLQIHGGADYETVRATLQIILDRFPGLPVADLAQSRLNILKLEIKGQRETPNKTMGVYEQNIGLKYGRPR